MQSPDNKSLAAFRLNDLRVDPAIGLISGPGGSVHLEPRVMGVLQTLARRTGELVSRAELLAENWPGGDIYDEALTQCIYQLRQQLASASGGSKHRNLITTVPKRGFILNGDVQPIEPESIALLDPVEPGEPASRDRPRSYMVWAIAALLVIGASWAVFEWRSGGEIQSRTEPLQTIAVLPFLPLMQEKSEPELELGMADTLITRLSRLDQIVVRPIAMVRGFGAMDRNSLEAGKALGVEAVVEGSIQRSGDLMRVTVRLLRVADGKALWAGTFDEPFADIFAMQDDICARISNALALHLGPEEQEDLARGGTTQTEAYLLYLKGRFHLLNLTAPEMRLAIDYFRQAIALDPDYAQAWLGLANVQFRMPLAGEAPPNEFFPPAKAAALRALEIDDRLAEGYAYLGWIAFWYEWDWGKSESHFQHALALNPNDFESHLGYAHLLSNTGRYEAALVEVRRARELGPFSPIAAMIEAMILSSANRPEEALKRLEEDRQIVQDTWLLHLTRSDVYLQLGRYEDALTEAIEGYRLSNGANGAMAAESLVLAKLGRRAEAEALKNQLLEASSQGFAQRLDLAVIDVALGDADSALARLEQGFVQREPKMTFLAVTEALDPIRTRPEFIDLLRRMNLLEAEERNQLTRKRQKPGS